MIWSTEGIFFQKNPLKKYGPNNRVSKLKIEESFFQYDSWFFDDSSKAVQ